MSDTARADRPRKKKKKGMSKGLLIGLIAGGAALLIGLIVLIVVLSSGGGGGGGKKDPPKEIVPAGPYVRPMEEKEALEKLRKIGAGYHAFVDANKRGAKDDGDLEKFLTADLLAMIHRGDGWIELIYDWTPTLLPEGSAKTIVAFERRDLKGSRVVLFGDNTAKVMTDDEIAKTPMAPGARKFEGGPLVLEGGKTRLGTYVRALSRIEAEITLKKIGDSYFAFELEKNRGPKELAELDCARDARVQGTLDPKEGWLTFIWGAGRRDMPEGPDQTILAYERESEAGLRYVIMGSGRTRVIDEEEFAKMPRAKGR